MTLHCAFIGFGKSTTRYHLPYVLNRKIAGMSHTFSAAMPSLKNRRHSIHIFTSPVTLTRS